jgi:hypothetical protein
MIQLGLQPVVCLLGKPGDVVVACLGHGYSLAAGRTVKVRRSRHGLLGVILEVNKG